MSSLRMHTISSKEQIDWYERHLHTGLRAAGWYIQEGLKNELGYKPDFPEFSWLQSSLLKPAFQHLCFRYKNQIFSILMAFVQNNDAYILQQDFDNQIRESKKYNLIPCIIPLRADNYEPLVGGYQLIKSDDGSIIDVAELSSDTLIEMSNWEILDMGIQIVKDDILKQGWKILSYCNVPGIEPQIWFEKNNGQRCYVVVSASKACLEKDKPLNINMYSQLKDYMGYYAKVSFWDLDYLGAHIDDGSKHLYRGHGLGINYKGLETIEKAAINTGANNDDIFTV